MASGRQFARIKHRDVGSPDAGVSACCAAAMTCGDTHTQTHAHTVGELSNMCCSCGNERQN